MGGTATDVAAQRIRDQLVRRGQANSANCASSGASVNIELAHQGHPDVRPAYGFAMQAIGRDGLTATELGRRLGVSKQAAGKTVDRLVHLGYAERVDDKADGRRRLVTLTPRGVDALARSATIFEELRTEWAGVLGAQRLRELTADLRTVAPADGFRMDVAGWFGG